MSDDSSDAAGASTTPIRSHFAREQARFFGDMWVCVARIEDLATPGDYVLRDIAGESVIVTRDGSGGFRGFYNVCRHRGTRLCTEAKGHFTERIQCPYHAWTYGLDGRLVSAPHMDGTPGFCKDDIALSAVHVDVWDGHVFANLVGQPRRRSRTRSARWPTSSGRGACTSCGARIA